MAHEPAVITNLACGMPARPSRHKRPEAASDKEITMLKAVGWIVLIIFIIGLLVVLGVFKAIF